MATQPKFELNRLNQDELTFELSTQGLCYVGTVEQMINALRRFVKL